MIIQYRNQKILGIYEKVFQGTETAKERKEGEGKGKIKKPRIYRTFRQGKY